MATATISQLARNIEIADQLRRRQGTEFEPQDLPEPFGRVVRAIDRILESKDIPAVLCGDWAVWRYADPCRLSDDLDIASPADRIGQFLEEAAVSGFEMLPAKTGRWPKLMHRETKVQVDILPEGARPGTANHLAPTTIPHPSKMGAISGKLGYVTLPRLIELKLAAGRPQDEADVVALLRANEGQITQLRAHVAGIH